MCQWGRLDPREGGGSDTDDGGKTLTSLSHFTVFHGRDACREGSAGLA
jgi:hypothetical protein